MTDAGDNATPKARTILVRITATPNGTVIVTPAAGDPILLTEGETTAELRRLARDPSQPVHVVEQVSTGKDILRGALEMLGKVGRDAESNG